jgi:DNA-binding protein H-NS
VRVAKETTVGLWEYRKIALNQLSPKTADVDVLNDGGDDGWELVAILPNNIAYLKREIEETISEIEERSAGQVAREEARRPNGNIPDAVRASEVKAKYRDPKTGETWSGRGRMATWLKRKQDAGEDIEKYLV